MMLKCLFAAALCSSLALPIHAQEPETLRFANRDWTVRDAGAEMLGPGPNRWDKRNAWVDDKGGLHLKISRREGVWSCAEVTLNQRLGFGRYTFQMEGRVDQLDPNVVCGLFLYPTKDVGPDATHEIDIEWARWGNKEYPIGNYTVWPTQEKAPQKSHTFPFDLNGDFSTHFWSWKRESVAFESFHGHRTDAQASFQKWEFRPAQAAVSIASKPMPLHFNLWLFRGQAPIDGKEVEVVIRDFQFVAE